MTQEIKDIIRSKSMERRLEIQMNTPEEIKKRKSKKFSEEIVDVIERFEDRFFSLDSYEEEVNEIIDSDFRWLSGKDDQYEEVQFKDELEEKKKATRSPKFNKWKKKLQEKFKVKIDFYEEYYHKYGETERDNTIFQGVKVELINKK